MGTGLAIFGWLATSLTARMTNLLSDPSLQGKSVELKLKKLRQILQNIGAVAGLDWKKQISSQSSKDWLWRFKEAVYIAEDAIDGFQYQVLKRSSMSKKRVSSSSSSSSQKSEASNSIKKALHTVLRGSSSRQFDQDDIKQLVEVTETFDELFLEISDLLKLVDQLEAYGGKQLGIPGCRLTTSHSTLRPTRGRDAESEVLLQALLDESIDDGNRFSLLSIVGPAGVGKTELARLAYNNAAVEHHFQTRAWVFVCRNFDLKRLMIEIIESASIERPKDLHSISSLEKIRDILAEGMKDKKFLLVLDDVWEEFISPWVDLSTLFDLGKEGSRIIVTTQLEKVATGIESKVMVNLDGLRPQDHWELFKECAFGEQKHTEHPNLERMGWEIAERFGGSPLAAVMIGRELKSDLREEHWRRIARKKLGVIEPREGDIASVLEFSYQQLPPQLKLCFLACALFPKNHCFEKDQLLRIWMALGVAPSSDGLDNEDSVDDLATRSFFVNSERKKNKFMIHAVLHELADLISDGEFFRLEDDIKDTEETAIPEKARHVYVTADNLIKVSDSLGEKENLVSLVIAGNLSPKMPPSDFMRSLEEVLKGSKRLRLLMISELPGDLPKAIGDLRHLRYLEFPCDEIKRLPTSFGMLHHLEWLNPKTGSKNLEFPKGMNKLLKLRCAIDDAEVTSATSSPERAINDESSGDSQQLLGGHNNLPALCHHQVESHRCSHSWVMFG